MLHFVPFISVSIRSPQLLSSWLPRPGRRAPSACVPASREGRGIWPRSGPGTPTRPSSAPPPCNAAVHTSCGRRWSFWEERKPGDGQIFKTLRVKINIMNANNYLRLYHKCCLKARVIPQKILSHYWFRSCYDKTTEVTSPQAEVTLQILCSPSFTSTIVHILQWSFPVNSTSCLILIPNLNLKLLKFFLISPPLILSPLAALTKGQKPHISGTKTSFSFAPVRSSRCKEVASRWIFKQKFPF